MRYAQFGLAFLFVLAIGGAVWFLTNSFAGGSSRPSFEVSSESSQPDSEDKADPRVKAFIDALRDTESSVRLQAALELGKLGDKAVPAIPDLMDALKDKEVDVRGAAAMALGRMGSQAKPAVTALGSILTDSERDVRCAAALALSRIGKEARPALPKLKDMAKGGDKLSQIYALWRFGRARREGRAPCERLMRLPDRNQDRSPWLSRLRPRRTRHHRQGSRSLPGQDFERFRQERPRGRGSSSRRDGQRSQIRRAGLD